MRQYIFDEFQKTVAISTIAGYLKKQRWCRKKAQAKAGQRNALLRRDFYGIQWKYAMEELVFLDESTSNERTGDRRYGWSPIDYKVQLSRPLIRTERHSVLPALDYNGWFTWMTVQGGITLELLLEFLRYQVLPLCNLQPMVRSVIVMDNALVHQSLAIDALCAEFGCTVLRLPPYSPDLNPIEVTFTELKKWLRLHEAEKTTFTTFHSFLDHAIRSVCQMDARGLFKKCGWRDGEASVQHQPPAPG